MTPEHPVYGTAREVKPYTKLSLCYDEVMAHVDYSGWIGYVKAICDRHDVQPRRTLDISCGIGKVLPYIQSWVADIFCMDLSSEMVHMLIENHPEMRGRVWAGEMSHLPLRQSYDLILNLQDSINYYQEEAQVTTHFGEVHDQLTGGGAYLFDFSTEWNIKNNFIDLREHWEDAALGYERLNTYLPKTKRNITEFYIWTGQTADRQVFYEKHVQRMYDVAEVRSLLMDSPFESFTMYADERLVEPDEQAERVHVIARRE